MTPLHYLAFCAITMALACGHGEQRRSLGEGRDSTRPADVALDTTSGMDSVTLARRQVELDRFVRGIRTLVARSEIDSSYAASFLAKVDRLTVGWSAGWTVPSEADTAFVSLLEHWIAAAQARPGSQQAAAYLAADQLLGMGMYRFGIADRSPSAGSAQERLVALGARIFYNDADAEWVYTHGWLVEAARRDRDSVGTQALVWKLEHWCDVEPGGGDHTDEAVADAQDLLSREVDPARRALAHFLIGDAQLDLISLAHGTDLFTDSTLYRGREVDARRVAVNEYQAGLAIDSASAVAQEARRHLRELLAGDRPTPGRFVCWRTE